MYICVKITLMARDIKREATSKALANNRNAEKYTYEDAKNLFKEAIVLSENLKYDFIGEVAKAQKITRFTYEHLTSRFEDLKELFLVMKSNLETNCYHNTKKGKINIAVGIINLKSNHKWTDRVDTTIEANIKGEFSIKDVLDFE